MFEILRKSLRTGIVTTSYPETPAEISRHSPGAGPKLTGPKWEDARPAAAACPTGAISCQDAGERRNVRLDLAKCTFCGLCAEADKTIRMTNVCECAARRREDLVTEASYSLKPDGRHERLLLHPGRQQVPPQQRRFAGGGSLDVLGRKIKTQVDNVLGRSLHIREVDAGSCNGCEIEIVGLNSPVYDLERFGIHFVASPRHADMLLVTGAGERNGNGNGAAQNLRCHARTAPGGGRGRLRLQRRNLWPKLRHRRRRGRGPARGRLHSRLPAQSARVAARHSGGHWPLFRPPPNHPIPRRRSLGFVAP